MKSRKTKTWTLEDLEEIYGNTTANNLWLNAPYVANAFKEGWGSDAYGEVVARYGFSHDEEIEKLFCDLVNQIRPGTINI